jgi:hypothetical protein
MRVVRQRPGTTAQTLASIGSGSDDANLHLDLLALGYAGVFVKLNGLAVNDAVDGSNHLEVSYRLGT